MLSVLSIVLGLLAAINGELIVYTQNIPHLIAEDFRDMPASFGPDLPSDGLRGLLVVGSPPDGCGNLTVPPDIENFTERWIVLLARNNCSFKEKVRNAIAAGYDCVIIHNVDSRELETMSASDREGIDIPLVSVSDDTGKLLAEKYTYNQGFYIVVNGDLPFNIYTRLLLPFAVVVVLCLFVILVFMIGKRIRCRPSGLPSRLLKQIPTCKFSKGGPYVTCAICQEDYQESKQAKNNALTYKKPGLKQAEVPYQTDAICLDDHQEGDHQEGDHQEGELLRVLPCGHAYHPDCLKESLRQWRPVCPLCMRCIRCSGPGSGPGSGRGSGPGSGSDRDAIQLRNLLPASSTQVSSSNADTSTGAE